MGHVYRPLVELIRLKLVQEGRTGKLTVLQWFSAQPHFQNSLPSTTRLVTDGGAIPGSYKCTKFHWLALLLVHLGARSFHKIVSSVGFLRTREKREEEKRALLI